MADQDDVRDAREDVDEVEGELKGALEKESDVTKEAAEDLEENEDETDGAPDDDE